ncbi:hypothetical protein BGP78_10950 [Pseudoalteromonas sp. MSK9-3]|uniref:hypothetical protein n=1 Tax=Pseudoalteromonas sp. MSK9-3 TaxID=1897633 RepID=UPI000E6C5C0F|nr:hypothetical protein [Pseudoalteromonas sp. MSK9-3]RJE76913.1 hypothetical protein BGP78_10950 [Pseudoalteromonas sp. MSK9-3]
MNRYVLLIIIGWMFFLFSDAVTRLTIDKANLQSPKDFVVNSEYIVPVLSDKLRKKIEANFQTLMSDERNEDDSSSNWPTGKEQEQQSGELYEFFINDTKLILKAIIVGNSSKYALVERHDKDNSVNMIKLFHGQTVSEFEVNIDTRLVVFTNGNRKVILNMFHTQESRQL